MNKPGVHRYTADSKQGRSMISPGQTHSPWVIPLEIRAWNNRVDELKQAKKLAKKGKK